jgi:AsmA protein
MPKILKYISITLAAVVLLLLVLVAVIVLTFNPNDYKPQITAAAKKATGRELTISGDIGLSLFPWLGMELGKTALSNASGFDDTPFAEVGTVEVKLKLLPLLRQEIEMKAIVLHGLHINLQVAEDGRNNWSDLAKSEEQSAEEQPTPAEQPAIKLAALVIGGIDMRDARFTYDNRATGARYAIEQLSLTTGPVALNAPLDIELNSKLSSSKPNVSGALAIKVRVIADTEKFTPQRLEQLHLTLDFNSPEFNSTGQLTLDSNIDIDLPGQRYSLSPTTLNANINNPGLPGGKATVQLSADINANLQQQTAQLNNLKLSSYGLDIQGIINASTILETPTLNGDLRIAEFSPRTLFKNMAITAPVTADPKVLNKAALELKLVDTTPSAIHIKPLKLTLDEITLQGMIDVELGDDRPLPAVRYQLSLDAIDADRYLAPPSDKGAVAAPTASSGAAAAAQLPMELLRKLDIDGKANIGRLTISKLHLNEIHTTLKAKDGVIKLAPVSAQLYQGSYEGNTTLDARSETPHFTLKESLHNIQAGPLLKDFMDNDIVNGKGSLDLDLTATGHSADEITKTLNGAINLSFANIAMKGLNIAAKAREAKAKIKGEKLSDSDSRPTDLSEVKGSFQVKNGIVSGNDLTAKAPFARINGTGSVDLVQSSLDYMVTAKIVSTTKGEGGADLDALKGLTIPVRISGPFTALKFDLQYDELLKAKLSQTKAELKERLDQEKAKLKADIDAKLHTEKEAVRQRLEAEKQKLKQEAEQRLKEQAGDDAKEKLKQLFNR